MTHVLRFALAFVTYASIPVFVASLRPHDSYAGTGTALLVLAYVFFLGARARRGRGRAAVVESKAMAALHRGDLQTAQEAFDLLGRDRDHLIAAISRHNLAWTAMRRGKLAAALDLYTDTDATYAKELAAAGMSAKAACDRAFALALLGRVDDAELALREAEDHATRQPARHSDAAMRVLVRATIDCRAGRAAAASKLLDERWAECEYTLTGSETRLVRVVRAFALAQSTGPRDAGIVDALAAQARPVTFDAEYTFLGESWPELATFLTTHGLA